MKLIIEADGPVLDVQPAYWQAHTAVLAELKLPATDPATFWRRVRAGAALASYIRDAKPRHIQTYRDLFKEHIESRQCVARCAPQPDIDAALRRITKHAECSLITVARNRSVRQELLTHHALDVHFLQMQGLFNDPARRPDQLRELAGDARRVIIVAASTEVVRAAAEAELLTVVVPLGTCTAKRLTQAGGGSATFRDIDAIADDLDHGAAQLQRGGLLPPARQREASPFVTPDHERRRSQRFNRSNPGRRR